MREEKKDVQQFYESYGWKKNTSGQYNDTSDFVDTREVMVPYYDRAIARLKKHIPNSGDLFMDVGCGPQVYDAYKDLSRPFARRLCVDFASSPLKNAKKELIDSALFSQADATNLPFRDNSIDFIFCSHMLYHVPQDEQESVVNELYRVLKPGGRMLIIYTWPRSRMDALGIHLNPRIIAPKIPGLRFIWRTFFKKRFIPNSEYEKSPEAPTNTPDLFFAPTISVGLRKPSTMPSLKFSGIAVNPSACPSPMHLSSMDAPAECSYPSSVCLNASSPN